MSFLSDLNSKKPFENLLFTNDNRVICQKHLEDLDSFYFRQGLLFGITSNIAACPKCEVPEDRTASCLATFQGYSANQCCVISPGLSQIALEPTPPAKNPSLDVEHFVAEHVLWDMKSNGFELKSLVYMKDQKILAACSKNGSVCFWSIGETLELKEPKLNLEKKINFAKCCKKYLVIGTDKGVYVYHMTGDTSSIKLLGVIDEEKIVSDLDFLENEGKIVTGYDESIVKVWSLETLEMEKIVDLHQYNIKRKIHTVMYIPKTGELAIEHANGLSVIKDWQHKEGSARHHLMHTKDSFGCKYLPRTGRFIMNNRKSDVRVLQEEDFAEVEKYNIPSLIHLGSESSFRRFIASQDESVIIANSLRSQLDSFQENTVRSSYLSSFIWGMSDVELIEDQYRIAVAHPEKGTVMIFRVNANMKIERNEGLPPLPAVKKAEDRLVSNTTQSGGLFSVGGGFGGGLFSGGSGRGLYSGGRGLFSRNSGLFSRSPPARGNHTGLSSGNSNKKSTTAKPKPASKPAKKGKKIQKVQLRSNTTKKKEKVTPSSVKKEKKKTSKKDSLKKQKKTEQNQNMIEAVRIKGKKKTKQEKVWVVLPSTDDDEKPRGRSLKKTPKTQRKKSNQKEKRKADLSKDKGSRSRSKSKSVTRKK